MPDRGADRLRAEIHLFFRSRLPIRNGMQAGSHHHAPEIPGYESGTPIDSGGMGEVWRAVESATGREVAIKLLSSARSGTSVSATDRLARFEREIASLSRLDHPNIVRYYSSGVLEDGTPYFVMEYVDGIPLETRSFANPMTARDVVSLMLPVCLAVGHAHRLGIIHRDLKPANILVTAEGKARLIDFGLVRLADADSLDAVLSRGGEVLGTPQFMAPEQAAGISSRTGTPADVWALGVILHRLLTGGRHPFDPSGSPMEIIARLQRKDCVRISEESLPNRDLRAIVGKCLAHDAGDRYASADALAADLSAWLDGQPVSARPPGAAEMLWRLAQRHRYGAMAAAACMVCATVFAIWYSVEKRRIASEREATLLRGRELVGQLMSDIHARLVDIGRPDLAEDAMKRAAEFDWHIDPGEGPAGEKDALRFRALAAISRAAAHVRQGQVAESIAAWREAAAGFDQLFASTPGMAAYRQEAGRAWEGCGRACFVDGWMAEAEAALTSAAARQLPELQAARMNAPESLPPAESAIETRLLHARVLMDSAYPEDADATLVPALECARRIVSSGPATISWQALHARLQAWQWRCRLEQKGIDPDAVVHLAAESLERIQPLAEGGGIDVPLALCELQITAANALRRLDRLTEAVESLERARRLFAIPPKAAWDSAAVGARVGLGQEFHLTAVELRRKREWSDARGAARSAAAVFDFGRNPAQTMPGSEVVFRHKAAALALSAECARKMRDFRHEGEDRFDVVQCLRRYRDRHPDTPEMLLQIIENYYRLHLLRWPVPKIAGQTMETWLGRIAILIPRLEAFRPLPASLTDRLDLVRKRVAEAEADLNRAAAAPVPEAEGSYDGEEDSLLR